MMLVVYIVVGDDDHGRCVRDLVVMERHILGTSVPVDVGEDDQAWSMTRSSRRCVNVKVDVERRDDLAMMSCHRSTWWRFVGIDIQHITAWLRVELIRPYPTCTCATWALAACCLVSGT
jgi:hypothetical protein